MSKNDSLNGTTLPLRKIRQRESAVPKHRYGRYQIADIISLSIQAANEDLITKQITIKLEEAGTLPHKIGSSKKYLITNLKIIGEINGTDLGMIHEMAGRISEGELTDGKLSVLDLSEARIVEGGGRYYTSNDVIGEFAFSGCSGLTSLTLPAGITEIGSGAFQGCSGLTSLNLPDGITSIGEYAFSGCI